VDQNLVHIRDARTSLFNARKSCFRVVGNEEDDFLHFVGARIFALLRVTHLQQELSLFQIGESCRMFAFRCFFNE
jgi:hypothetical protein